jgi:2-C-methyl-D-erythritol 4-phosphate cytidylyltransferase
MISPNPQFFAVIPCGGTGTRAGAGGPKQYHSVAGQAVVMHTLKAFSQVPQICRSVVAVAAGDDWWTDKPLPNATFSIANCAGTTRAITVFNALNHLKELGAGAQDWVLVHDAARCLIEPAQIEALMKACADDEVGGLLALRLPDTLKAEREGRVVATVNRADKWLAQTPQMFRLGLLTEALQKAGDAVTDESSAVEMLGLAPRLIEGSPHNLKITYPPDFALAEAILKARAA